MARKFCILSTAGHIDHGKSALVKALTGSDPDRLPEEKRRGMTIVLGFARLSLPTGGDGEVQIGIVDVPGHERFVRTMVAGATGVDLGLLVVAADDGIMPQTREHVEILDLLGISTGVVAITKADLVPTERIETVRAEIADVLRSTLLRDWPVVVTSAKSGDGLDRLRIVLGELVAGLSAPSGSAIFRLAIDRVFPIHGRGTVVTGSVLCGKVAPGTTLELHPPAVSCKVREVQSHGRSLDDVGGGQRAALNLTGIDRGVVQRGMELATPGYLRKSRYVDARVRILARRDRPFASHQRTRVSIGTAEHLAMLVVVGAEEIPPSADALVQLQFRRPVVASFGQRFILRNESAQATIGGGRVVRPTSRRVRPKLPQSLVEMQRAESSEPAERLAEAVRRAGFVSVSATGSVAASSHAPMRLACETGIEPDQVVRLLEQMKREQTWTPIGSYQVHRDTLAAVERRAVAFLDRHHATHATEPGLSKDRFVGWIEARTAAGLGRAILDRLVAQNQVTVHGPYVARRSFRPALSDEDSALLEALVTEITRAGFDPPEWNKLAALRALSKPRAKVLTDLAKVEPRLVSFASQRYISKESLERFKKAVGELGGEGRRFKLAEVRDRIGQSRRVVQPLLEYLDRFGFTKRIGDERILLSPPGRSGVSQSTSETRV